MPWNERNWTLDNSHLMHNGSQETISEYKQLSDLDQLQLMQALYVKEDTDQHKIRVIFI